MSVSLTSADENHGNRDRPVAEAKALLSPAARAEAQRILNSAARRILAERERESSCEDDLEAQA
jgi:hypothetical protein